MTDQTQNAQTQDQPQIKIGFEANLELLNPEWRKLFTPEQVNQFRFFYQSAMRDLSMFIGAAKQTNDNMVQAFQFMDANAVATHNNPPVEPPQEPATDVEAPKVKATKPVGKAPLKVVPNKVAAKPAKAKKR